MTKETLNRKVQYQNYIFPKTKMIHKMAWLYIVGGRKLFLAFLNSE